MSRGFILVEVSIAYVLLTLALLALLPVFIMAIRAGANTGQLQTATYLSGELLEEVRMRKWDENFSTAMPKYVENPSALGLDAGETASDKTTFDDLDDFNGWSEAASDPLNIPLPGFSAYTRTVAVSYVDSSLADTGGVASDYKQVKVCTRTAKIKPLCLVTVFTNR